MTRATRFILAAANRSEASGITVDCDSAYSTVSIDATGLVGGCDGVFMQGDEADQFIAERDALTKRYPSLTDYEAEMALAWPYAENCLS
jgi:hypothetical protein